MCWTGMTCGDEILILGSLFPAAPGAAANAFHKDTSPARIGELLFLLTVVV